MGAIKTFSLAVAVILMSIALLASSLRADADGWNCAGTVSGIQFACYGKTSSICADYSAPRIHIVCRGTKYVVIKDENTEQQGSHIE
jgi:hypothetical protein